MMLKNKPVWRGRTGPAQPWVTVMLAQVLAVITDKVHPLQSVAAHDQTSDWLAHSGINIDKIFYIPQAMLSATGCSYRH